MPSDGLRRMLSHNSGGRLLGCFNADSAAAHLPKLALEGLLLLPQRFLGQCLLGKLGLGDGCGDA